MYGADMEKRLLARGNAKRRVRFLAAWPLVERSSKQIDSFKISSHVYDRIEL